MSATQVKMERESMYKWKKAYEAEAQDHIATSLNLQKLTKELEAKLAIAIEAIRYIRSSCDCRNESESEQCSHVAEEALEKVRGEV